MGTEEGSGPASNGNKQQFVSFRISREDFTRIEGFPGCCTHEELSRHQQYHALHDPSFIQSSINLPNILNRRSSGRDKKRP